MTDDLDPVPTEYQHMRAEIERLRAAGINLIAAMDDMHARGETFTARVSVASADMRRALEPKP